MFFNVDFEMTSDGLNVSSGSHNDSDFDLWDFCACDWKPCSLIMPFDSKPRSMWLPCLIFSSSQLGIYSKGEERVTQDVYVYIVLMFKTICGKWCAEIIQYDPPTGRPEIGPCWHHPSDYSLANCCHFSGLFWVLDGHVSCVCVSVWIRVYVTLV